MLFSHKKLVGLLGPELTGKTFLVIALKYNMRIDIFFDSLIKAIHAISYVKGLHKSLDRFIEEIPRLRSILNRNPFVKRSFRKLLNKYNIKYVGYNNVKKFYDLLNELENSIINNFLQKSFPKSTDIEVIELPRTIIQAFPGSMMNLGKKKEIKEFAASVGGRILYIFSPSNIYSGGNLLMSFRGDDYLKVIDFLESKVIYRSEVSYVITMVDEIDPSSFLASFVYSIDKFSFNIQSLGIRNIFDARNDFLNKYNITLPPDLDPSKMEKKSLRDVIRKILLDIISKNEKNVIDEILKRNLEIALSKALEDLEYPITPQDIKYLVCKTYEILNLVDFTYRRLGRDIGDIIYVSSFDESYKKVYALAKRIKGGLLE